MDAHNPPISLPEELLLICADPADGQVKPSAHFNRVLAGALLTELLLAGAITVEGRHIVEVRAVPTGYPAADQLCGQLSAALGKRRRLKLERWVRTASHRANAPQLESLAARGLLVTHRSRILFGLLPHTVRKATETGWDKAAAGRILRELEHRSDPRTLHLAALVGAVRLDRRLFNGPDARRTRREVRALTRATPIADAVRRVIRSDSSGDGGS